MNLSQLYQEILIAVSAALTVLPDKPEETPDTTLRALWFAAANQPCSVAQALSRTLPSLDPEAQARLDELIQKRLTGVPLAHLTGRQNFMGLDFLAGPEALVPRQETELLGHTALAKLRTRLAEDVSATIIDVCTGSGNLAIALAHQEPRCQVFASDLSADAVGLARQNVAHHGLGHRVDVMEGDLFAPFAGPTFQRQVDLVVCNPPYISSGKINTLPPEIVDFEPHLAFDGGGFGFSLLSRLIQEAPRYLRPSAWLCFEVGRGQGDYLGRSLKRLNAYRQVESICDASGEIRVLAAQAT